MKNWKDNGDGTVSLFFYTEKELKVKREDFVRAFGTMINSSREEIERDFAIKEH